MRLIVISAFILLLTVASSAVSPNSVNFGIYLVSSEVDARVFAQTPERWKSVPLEAEPIISDQDILVYDFSKHAMQLTPAALKRLPRPPVTGIPFVVVVNGERIYPGVFYTQISSITCNLPVIVTDRRNESTRSDVLFIERAYPQSHAQGEDFRSDEKIRTTFATLRKLRSL